MELIISKTKKKKLQKNVKIATTGCLNGTWLIEISNIHDADLYDVEVALLALFDKKKKQQD